MVSSNENAANCSPFTSITILPSAKDVFTSAAISPFRPTTAMTMDPQLDEDERMSFASTPSVLSTMLSTVACSIVARSALPQSAFRTMVTVVGLSSSVVVAVVVVLGVVVVV